MTDGTSAPDLKAARAVVRDRLFAIARQYQALNAPDMEQQLALLRWLADAAGFHILAGLARALEDKMAACPCLELTPIFLHYMTRALMLEPSSDRAILNLLLDGIQRRLDEACPHCQQMEA